MNRYKDYKSKHGNIWFILLGIFITGWFGVPYFNKVSDIAVYLWLIYVVFSIGVSLYKRIQWQRSKSPDEVRVPLYNDDASFMAGLVLSGFMMIGGGYGCYITYGSEFSPFMFYLFLFGLLTFCNVLMYVPGGVVIITNNTFRFKSTDEEFTIGIDEVTDIEVTPKHITLTNNCVFVYKTKLLYCTYQITQ